MIDDEMKKAVFSEMGKRSAKKRKEKHGKQFDKAMQKLAIKRWKR